MKIWLHFRISHLWAGILGISFLVSIPGKFYFPSLEPELAQPKQGNGKQKSCVFTQNSTSNDLVKYSFELFAYKYRIQVVVFFAVRVRGDKYVVQHGLRVLCDEPPRVVVFLGSLQVGFLMLFLIPGSRTKSRYKTPFSNISRTFFICSSRWSMLPFVPF